MRGHCGLMNRAINDAKHIAKPFRKAKRFTIILDHNSRCRSIIFNLKSYYITVASRLEDL